MRIEPESFHVVSKAAKNSNVGDNQVRAKKGYTHNEKIPSLKSLRIRFLFSDGFQNAHRSPRENVGIQLIMMRKTKDHCKQFKPCSNTLII